MEAQRIGPGKTYHLRLLGRVSLTDERGRPAPRAATQPRRLALLAVLATQPGRGLSRDQLVGLFWPGKSEDTARHNVADVLYRLRRALGEDVFHTGQRRVRLDVERVGSDVAAFHERLEAGALEEAVECYAGPFMEGFRLRRCTHEFEEWVEAERRRHDALYREALETLAARASAEGDLAARVARWELLTESNPFQTRYVLGLVEALTDAGDVPGALRHARRHTELLRRELGLPTPPSLTSAVDKIVQATKRPPAKGHSDPGEFHRPGDPSNPNLDAPDAPVGTDGIPTAPHAVARIGDQVASRGSAGRSTSSPSGGGSRTLLALAAIASAFTIVAVTWMTDVSDGEVGPPGATPPSRPVIASTIMDSVARGLAPDLSDDGTVAYVRGREIWARPAGTLQWMPVPGTEGVSLRSGSFSLSPDGTSIAFSTSDSSQVGVRESLHRAPIRGGPVEVLWTFPADISVESIQWGHDDWIYFTASRGWSHQLVRIPATGGPPDSLYASRPIIRDPVPLPGGRAVLVTIFGPTPERDRLVTIDLQDRVPREVVSNAHGTKWAGSGHLVYADDRGALFALPFDSVSLAALGPRVPLLLTVGIAGSRNPLFDLSTNGTLTYVLDERAAPEDDFRFAVWEGPETIRTLPIGTDHPDAALSPDKGRIAFVRRRDLWAHDLRSGSTIRLAAAERSLHHDPVWSPDGSSVAFWGTGGDVYTVAADGSERVRRLGGFDKGGAGPTDWSRRGVILFNHRGADVYRLRVSHPGVIEPVLVGDRSESGARLSPDERWVAYLSDQTGALHAYLRPWPHLGPATQLSVGQPLDVESRIVWSTDGTTIYVNQGGTVQAITIDIDLDESVSVLARQDIGTMPGKLLDLVSDEPTFLIAAHTHELERASATSPELVIMTGWIESVLSRLDAP